MSSIAAVDWDVAVSTARRITRRGPDVGITEARAAVADLRKHAADARGHVERVTGLRASTDDSPVEVVDRAGWVAANAAGFRTVVDPFVASLQQSRDGKGPGGLGSRLTGAQFGVLLGYLSSRVLGQYELFTPPGATPRLLLVAPNIVAAEQAMDVDPRDFRLWVAVHEETHRVQLTAVPWLAGYVRNEVDELLAATDLEGDQLADRLRSVTDTLRSAVRGDEGPPLSEVVTTPEQRAAVERVTTVMTLLEGHADHVMDAVGSEVIPTVDTIRARFEERRRSAGRFESVVRRLLGIDEKLAQYRNGSAFVRGVVAEVGMRGFNHVWISPETLPTSEEISDPAAWVRRVHPE